MEKNKKAFNILKAFFAVILVLPCLLVFSACSFGNGNGMSAYEIAVKNGFTGTEKEWLASLKGSDGTDGTDGENVTISTKQLYDEAFANGEFTGTYLEFIKKYFSTTDEVVDESVVANYCAMSVCEVVGYKSSGSGVVYSLDNQGNAYIITNYHVTYSQTQNTINGKVDRHYNSYKLYFYGRTDPVDASFVGGSKRYDISVIKVSNCKELLDMGVKPAEFRNSPVHLGEKTMAIGNTLGYGVTVSTGVVSVDSEIITNEIGDSLSYRRAIRTTAFIEHGSSGGALFDEVGKLIGITNSGKEGYAISYAIPATIVEVIVPKIIEGDKSVAKLGITTNIDGSMTYFNEKTNFVEVKENVVVTGVSAGSIMAEKFSQGEIKTGDIITAVTINEETTEVLNNYQISELLLSTNVGDIVKLSLTRDLGTSTLKTEVEVTLTSACFVNMDDSYFFTIVPTDTTKSNASIVSF